MAVPLVAGVAPSAWALKRPKSVAKSFVRAAPGMVRDPRKAEKWALNEGVRQFRKDVEFWNKKKVHSASRS